MSHHLVMHSPHGQLDGIDVSKSSGERAQLEMTTWHVSVNNFLTIMIIEVTKDMIVLLSIGREHLPNRGLILNPIMRGYAKAFDSDIILQGGGVKAHSNTSFDNGAGIGCSSMTAIASAAIRSAALVLLASSSQSASSTNIITYKPKSIQESVCANSSISTHTQ